MPLDHAALPPLLVFGEALTDFVMRGDSRWQSAAGGSCWNVARVTSMLGVHTGWGGAVSCDLFGDEIVEKSARAGLDKRFLQRVNKPPLMAMVHRTDPPDYFFLGTDTADLAFDDAALPDGWQAHCQIAHFGCISLVREPLASRLVGIARQLRQQGTRISFDANYRNLMGADYATFFESMVANADIVKVSDEDVGRIYPGQPQAEVLARLQTLQPQAMLLYTRGAEGMTLFVGDRRYEQPAIRVEVSDTVGAGDACIGGLLASMQRWPEGSEIDHLRFAAATAAAACTRTGAHAPTLAEVEALLRDAAAPAPASAA